MGRKGGNPDINKINKSTRFSSTNQPPNERKQIGQDKLKMKKLAIESLGKTLLTDEAKEKTVDLFKTLGFDFSDAEFTLEIVMLSKQIEKAIEHGDTKAFNAAMDRMVGKSLQRVDHNGTLGVFDPTKMSSEELRKYLKSVNDEINDGKF